MRATLLAALFVLSTATTHAQQPTTLDPATQAKVDAIATKVLHDTGVPSASIAIARGGQPVYARAFGLADVAANKPAQPAMAYPIGSISKQFTAQAVLLLAQEGKLSLDDKVSKFFPELTRANEVTLRNLMTMTSGYEDFAPQDYIIPAWRHPIRPIDNVHTWAEKPLDFDPGTDWQYSNTNYVLVGLIVEKVTGEPFYQFLRERVLSPLKLEGVFNTYNEREKLEVTGYVSNALAPVRVLPLEATGWYFADGELSMPASTLVAWDLAIARHALLAPAGYQQFEAPFILKSGRNTSYGLGTYVRSDNGHLQLSHGGEVGGYVSQNIVYPDLGTAIVVLTNEVASDAAGDIAQQIARLLVPPAPAAATPPDTFGPRLSAILTALQSGHIDPALLTPDCQYYFDAPTLADFQSTLAPLGPIQSVDRTYTHLRGGMTGSLYKATFADGTVVVSTYLTPDGKIEQLLITGKA